MRRCRDSARHAGSHFFRLPLRSGVRWRHRGGGALPPVRQRGVQGDDRERGVCDVRGRGGRGNGADVRRRQHEFGAVRVPARLAEGPCGPDKLHCVPLQIRFRSTEVIRSE